VTDIQGPGQLEAADQMGTKHAKRVRDGMDRGWPILRSRKEKIVPDLP
jgi:hypothetical protein